MTDFLRSEHSGAQPTTLSAHTGLELPVLGFGTSKLRGKQGAEAVAHALQLGYRLIDAAYNYENEGAVGVGIRSAIAAGEITRGDVLVTSKLPGRYQEATPARQAIEESLMRLGLDYLDLYLIHWPNPRHGHFVEAWQTMQQARDEGLIRHIGVCNFLPDHFNTLVAETGELPAVNQIELHPRFPQNEALAYHQSRGIITQAWSPLLRGAVADTEPVVAAAKSHGASPSQVILAWHRQRGSLAIPKATHPQRQRENWESLQVELTAQELDAITALGRPDGRMKGQNPADYEEF